MADLLRKLNKALLLEVAEEFETDVTSKPTVRDIRKAILGASDFEVELLKISIERITSEAEHERLDKFKLAEQERLEKQAEREFELEKLRLGNASEVASLNSNVSIVEPRENA